MAIAALQHARRIDPKWLAIGLVAAVSAVMSAWMVSGVVPPTTFRADYFVFWTAARLAPVQPELLYDFEAMTLAQAWLADPEMQPRPWAYPPSALPLFAPFALLPAWPSLLAWNLVSIAVYVAAARRIAGPGLPLVLVSPAVIWCLLSGQTALLMGGLILLALCWLRDRPIAAGIALGLVAVVKPQALLLAPLALARGGHGSTAAAAVAAALAMVLASLPYGLFLWRDWFIGLDQFAAVAEAMNLHRMGLSPASFAQAAGLPDAARILLQLAGIVVGAALVWRAFATDDLVLRAAALIGGSILCSPYAMPYELAMLAPAAAAALIGHRRWGLLAGLPLTGFGGLAAVLALLLPLFRREGAADMVNNRLKRD